MEIIGKLITEDKFYTDPWGDNCHVGYDNNRWVVGPYWPNNIEEGVRTIQLGDTAIEFAITNSLVRNTETMWDGDAISDQWGGDVHKFLEWYIGEVSFSQDTEDGRATVVKRPTSTKYELIV